MDEIDLTESPKSPKLSPTTILQNPDPLNTLNETNVSVQEISQESSEVVQSDSIVSTAINDVSNPNPVMTSSAVEHHYSVPPPPPPYPSPTYPSSSYAPAPPSTMAGNPGPQIGPPQINPYLPTESTLPPSINPTIPVNYGQALQSPLVMMPTGSEPPPPQYSTPISQPAVFYTNQSNVINQPQQQQHSMNSPDDENVTLPDDLVDVYNHLGIVGKLLTGGSIFTIRFLQMFRNISETLVDALGITRPRYEGEYLAFEQMKQEELQRQANIETLYATWQQPNPNTMPLDPTTSLFLPPITSPVPDHSGSNKTATDNNTINPTSNISVVNMSDCPSPPNP